MAARTGYVPKTLMATPLLHGERAVGVFSVLDRDQQTLPELAAMDLLGACARLASIAAELVESLQTVAAVARGEDPELAAVARLATALEGLGGGRREDALDLCNALERLLRAR